MLIFSGEGVAPVSFPVHDPAAIPAPVASTVAATAPVLPRPETDVVNSANPVAATAGTIQEATLPKEPQEQEDQRISSAP